MRVNSMKKSVKILAGITAFILIEGILWFASEILLYIKKILDEKNVSFYAIDFILEKPRKENKEIDLNQKIINIKDFLV